ncbi:MAG TPA: metallopeptidase family protein [Verrucomicrobiae bacterium]|nr:metallopeptidase family protein [Verrucomicrobiae bacterium]
MNFDWEKIRAIATEEVETTLLSLPKPLRAQARKLPVTFECRPNAELQADGIEMDTLGLFTGAEFADEGNVPMPPQIILFLGNLWDFTENNEGIFRDEIRMTFLHELGHYFGLDENDLTERGLD